MAASSFIFVIRGGNRKGSEAVVLSNEIPLLEEGEYFEEITITPEAGEDYKFDSGHEQRINALLYGYGVNLQILKKCVSEGNKLVKAVISRWKASAKARLLLTEINDAGIYTTREIQEEERQW